MKPLGWLIIGVVVAVLITGALSDSSPFGGWPPAGGEPYVGPEQPPSPEYPWGRPTQTGIVPTLILQDSYGVNHTLRSKTVPLSTLGEPTIPASRGELFLSLQIYFEVDDALYERKGRLTDWSLEGQIFLTTDCPSPDEGYYTEHGFLGRASFSEIGDSTPDTAFSPFVISRKGFEAEGSSLTYDLTDCIDNGHIVYGNLVRHLDECASGQAISKHGATYRFDAVRDIFVKVSYTLTLTFEGGVEVKSGSGELAHLYLYWDPEQDQLWFFDQANISRETMTEGLSILPEAKVRF